MHPPAHRIVVRHRVARRPQIRPYPAHRAVAAQHVRELVAREVGQLVERNQRDLRALIVEPVLLVLHVRKLHRGAAGELPFQQVLPCLRPQQRIELHRLIPQSAGIAHLDGSAAKDHRIEIGVARMAQRLKKKSKGFSTPCRSAINDQICRRREKRLLRTCLRPNLNRHCSRRPARLPRPVHCRADR